MGHEQEQPMTFYDGNRPWYVDAFLVAELVVVLIFMAALLHHYLTAGVPS
jgi:hypothetical protein